MLQILIQVFYGGWNLHCILTPVRQAMTPVTQPRRYIEGEFALAYKSRVPAPVNSPVSIPQPDTQNDNVQVDD
jgi:hypothetical protein